MNEYEPHGFDHAPIFKFGDGNPELTSDVLRRQKSLNSSVYNRDVCEEFGAFEQKALIGWDGTEEQKAKAGMTKVLAFQDDDVKIQSFPASDLRPFIEAVDAKKLAIAQAMQVSPALLVPAANMAADMIALANAPYGRKLQTKQRIFGEDIERWLRARAARNGIEVPDDAETVWDETEPRSYAAVIDGITKLASVQDRLTKGLVEDIPGWTTQKVDSFLADVRRLQGSSVLDRLREASATADPAAPDTSTIDEANAIKAKFDALGVAIRAGVDPDEAAVRVGLAGVKFTGATPVSLRVPESQAATLEER